MTVFLSVVAVTTQGGPATADPKQDSRARKDMNYRCAASAKNAKSRSASTVFGNVAPAAAFSPRSGPQIEGLGIHRFLHTALSHFLKESLVKNTLPPPDLPLWMYGYIEYLILKIEEGLYV